MKDYVGKLERANLRLSKSVSDPYRAKIKTGRIQSCIQYMMILHLSIAHDRRKTSTCIDFGGPNVKVKIWT